jgi:hypothetical protein
MFGQTRIWNQYGGKCETWLARQLYDELHDITTRIGDIMRGILLMLDMTLECTMGLFSFKMMFTKTLKIITRPPHIQHQQDPTHSL